MMNGGDLYELAKILGHSNIKMTERYAKLGRKHIARNGNTAREIWKLMENENGKGEQEAGGCPPIAPTTENPKNMGFR